LYGIEVREYVAVTLVELRGELDLFSLSDLKETLNRVLSLSRPARVDLSGITFLDLHSARELVLRYQLHADHLTLSNPSRWVSASIEAFGLAAWIRFHLTSDRKELPLVSEASN
jgi:anti-anti-sigma factor